MDKHEAQTSVEISWTRKLESCGFTEQKPQMIESTYKRTNSKSSASNCVQVSDSVAYSTLVFKTAFMEVIDAFRKSMAPHGGLRSTDASSAFN